MDILPMMLVKPIPRFYLGFKFISSF